MTVPIMRTGGLRTYAIKGVAGIGSALPFYLSGPHGASEDEQLYPAVLVCQDRFIGGCPTLGPYLDPLLRDSPVSHQLRHVFRPGEGQLRVESVT